ncbi:MAG: lysophospholipid acyltransferase family protein [Bdellovibrionales bacterium]|nr:lysophospholipid acyltransferase family protein [Bdellovibrionales bacterium]
MRSLIATYRIEVRGQEQREKAKKLNPKGSFVFAVWHEQVVSVLSAHAWTQPYLALSSRSKDGDYAAFVSEKMGFVAVRGSSRKRNVDKGGKEAIQEYVAKLNQGISGGLTVDGPKGPRQKCKVGAVLIAQQTGAPILPVVGIANRYWEFNSWDKFKIPKPFANIVMLYGEPVVVEADASPERIEQICNQVSEDLKNLAVAASK